ncbi:hypothetical protein Barb7_02958 [Bacteroidales bacterium Barb7]|nr:hypothetical protein Barb7_02958 [Bacteroidales bacterium Barb7]
MRCLSLSRFSLSNKSPSFTSGLYPSGAERNAAAAAERCGGLRRAILSIFGSSSVIWYVPIRCGSWETMR